MSVVSEIIPSHFSASKKLNIPGTHTLPRINSQGSPSSVSFVFVGKEGYIAFKTSNGWKMIRNNPFSDLEKMKYKMKITERQESAVIRPSVY
jgi:hypothetical protein